MTKLAFLSVALALSLSYLSCGSCENDPDGESDTIKKTINLKINGVVGFDSLSKSIPDEDASRIITRSDITSPVPSPAGIIFKVNPTVNYKNIDSDTLKELAVIALITDTSAPENPELTENNFVDHILSWALVDKNGNFTIEADVDESESFIVWILLPFYDFTAELTSKLKKNMKVEETDSDKIGILIKVSDLDGNTEISGGNKDASLEFDGIEVSSDVNGNLTGITQTSFSEAISSPEISINQINLSLGTISVIFGEEIEQNTLTTSSLTVTNSSGESLCESLDYDEDNMIYTCRITPPDCETLDNLTLKVIGVANLDGNVMPEYTETFSTHDDYFNGETLSACWTLTGDSQETISVKDGELNYLSTNQNEEDFFLSKTLKDTIYGVGIHLSNTDLSNINKKQGINFVLQNDIATHPAVAIQLARDSAGDTLLRSGINSQNEGGIEVGETVEDISMTEISLCLTRDDNSARVYYSLNGKSWTELSLPAHTMDSPTSSAFTMHFVNKKTVASTWAPIFSAIKFLNFNKGDDYACPTF